MSKFAALDRRKRRLRNARAEDEFRYYILEALSSLGKAALFGQF